MAQACKRTRYIFERSLGLEKTNVSASYFSHDHLYLYINLGASM